jgi:hypothetical protein
MPQPPRAPRPRLPAFVPVPVRPRSDGWVAWRQAEFVGKLAETGSVSAAAAHVGMARETAYRLRRKPGAESFALAWDVAMRIACERLGRAAPAIPALGLAAVAPKVTPAELWRRIVEGTWRPVLRRGKYVGSVHKADDSALSGHMARLGRSMRRRARSGGAG